eukprot:216850-Chlamydomonas_euryale.AAC.1
MNHNLYDIRPWHLISLLQMQRRLKASTGTGTGTGKDNSEKKQGKRIDSCRWFTAAEGFR